MKKIYFLLYFTLLSNIIFGQKNDTENFLHNVKKETVADKRIDLILSYFALPINESELKRARIAQKLLNYSYTNNDKIAEALALKEISYFYFRFGKYNDGLDVCLKGLKIAEKVNSDKLIGHVSLNLSYFYDNFNKNNSLLKKSLTIATKINDDNLKLETYKFLSELYLDNNKITQSLYYSQKSIYVFDKTKQKSGYFRNAEILLDIYSKTNIDSAYKYSEKLRIGIMDYLTENSSNDNLKIMLDEELRQKSLAEEKEKLEEEKKQNLQYTLISIGILVLLSFYLIVTKSFIVSSKVIKFIGIISLLIVFEFINLLIHPFLEKITHHSPILILLALVVIAAILVPLHHKVEHLFVAKMIEKNKNLKIKKAVEIINNSEEENP